MPKSVLITGATRGLGLGMARHFAQRGYSLAITGRKQEDLEQVKRELESLGAGPVVASTLEVTDYHAHGPCLLECAGALGGLDIVVANAGIGFSTPAGEGHFDGIRQHMEVNVTGAIATCEAAIEYFREQGHGQLVGVTSFAKLRGNPRDSGYSASKAALATYLESVRCDTYEEPIVVTELAPGFIDTDINKDIEERPFLVSAEKGTGVMVDLIEKQVSVSFVPPWPWKLVAALFRRMSVKRLRNI